MALCGVRVAVVVVGGGCVAPGRCTCRVGTEKQAIRESRTASRTKSNGADDYKYKSALDCAAYRLVFSVLDSQSSPSNSPSPLMAAQHDMTTGSRG